LRKERTKLRKTEGEKKKERKIDRKMEGRKEFRKKKRRNSLHCIKLSHLNISAR
jgi:hypothetical protein